MRRVPIAVGVILIIAGGLLSFIAYDIEETGESRVLAAVRGPMVTFPVRAAIGRGEREIWTLTWFTFKPPPTMAMALAKAQVLALAQHVTIDYGGYTRFVIPAFGVAAQVIPAENIYLAAALPSVAGIEYDRVIRVPIQSTSESGGTYLSIDEVMELVDMEELWEIGRGEGMDIAVLDSGAPRDLRIASIAAADEGTNPYDDFGHGGSVIHIIHSISPQARIHSIKVLDQYGMGRISTILKGLEMALHLEPRPDIVHASLGASPTLFDSLSMAFETAVRSYGVVAVAAAGNDPTYESSPANSPLVVSVGAIGSDLKLTDYSAPSFNVVSIGDQKVIWLGSVQLMRGTSFSSPVVSAQLLDYMSGTGVMPEEFDEIATLLIGSELTLEGYPLPSGVELAAADPIPETPLMVKLAPWLAVVGAGAVLTFVAIYWRRERKEHLEREGHLKRLKWLKKKLEREG